MVYCLFSFWQSDYDDDDDAADVRGCIVAGAEMAKMASWSKSASHKDEKVD